MAWHKGDRTQASSMQCRGHGVDLVDVESTGLYPPYCPHGPTMVFERYYGDREPRQFFACAVHRDRRGCPFFHWVDEGISEEKRERWKAIYKQTQPVLDRTALTERLATIRSSPPSQCSYCHTCSSLVLVSERGDHEGHQVKERVTEEEIEEPTRLVCPVDDRKSQAQFYFSSPSLDLLHSEIKRLGFTRLLCVGTPRLHETVLKSGGIKSLLLDIDHRYAQFYPNTCYQRYNMFNGFFYEASGQEICQEFLQSDPSKPVAMVIDPPFGGLAEMLAVGVKKLWKMARHEIPTLLVFPYFMESHISSSLPSLVMTDYQVTYDNHRHFSEDRKKSRPSPVRVFTNIPPPGLILPADLGYKFCALCNRYVCSENFHCKKCSCCTSKDGRRYIHCDVCGVCVKSGRVHCTTCNRCELPSHTCGTRSSVGCHICGSTDHKRRECPEKEPRSLTRSKEQGPAAKSKEQGPAAKSKGDVRKLRKRSRTERAETGRRCKAKKKKTS